MSISPSEWARVRELFHTAVELPQVQRHAYLEQHCNGDADLRREVESLLAADEEGESFIETPIAHIPHTALDQPEAEELDGRQFGAYRIMHEIARGGLGTVYLAERTDDVYRKQVALKLVRRGLDTEDILRRFRHERQILAQLDHPNIARIIDGGTIEEGLPYFVMEYVPGQPITAWCDEHKTATRDRLQLFRKVCAAVTYAHQHLIIHRDLKPSNILVTAEGEPKLLDFGIAKLLTTEAELFTQTSPALRVMTPEYASPEQVRGGNITTATDVYSLGVILYELLTGKRPYRLTTRTSEELARAVVEQEPARPSTAAIANHKSPVTNHKALRGDLDNIVLMAIRKEPQRRYSSVTALSEDIRQHLEGLPVTARTDTWSYRAGKFIKRNKAGVAAAVLVFLSLIGGIAATVWQAKKAMVQRDRAQKRFNDVRRLSNALLFDIAPKVERIEGSMEARKALVNRALEYLDSLGSEAADDAQLQSELAAAYEKVGELQGSPRKPNLNDFTGAIRSYEKARAFRTGLFESTGQSEQLERIAADLATLATLNWLSNDIKDSLECSKAAMEAYARLLAIQPGSRPLQVGQAEAQIELAATHYYNEELPKALPLLRDALQTLEPLRLRYPEDTEIRRPLARAHTLLGISLSWNNQQEEGEREMAKALALGEELMRQNPSDNIFRQGLLDTTFQAAQLFENVDNARAFDFAARSRDLAEEMARSDPADIHARQNVAKSYSLLGQIAVALGKPGEAVGYLAKSAQVFAELVTRDPAQRAYKHDQGRVLMALGTAFHLRKDFPRAIETYDQALALFAELQRLDPGNNFHLRKMEELYSYKGDACRALAESNNAEQRQQYLSAAKANYQRALDILLQLEAQQSLSDYDRKELSKMKSVLAQL